tara:strand:- start:91 stop:996 length:906 start_codon:yes stop_codon:yes gene_type:complete
MALDNGTTTVTASASVLGGVGKVLGDAVIAFNKANVVAPLVLSKTGVTGAKTVEFADWKVAASSDVGAATEAGDETAQQIDTTARTATLSEHVIQVDISDLAEQGYGADGGGLGSNAGAVIGNALAAKLDNDLVALFAPGSLTNDAAAAGTALAVAHIFDCLRILHSNQAPAPLNLVLGLQQMWGAKGLQTLVQGAAAPTATNLFGHNQAGTELANTGFVTRFAGFDVYTTPEIAEDGSNDEAGCAFSAGAFGYATGSKGVMSIETQRDASKRITEYVGTGVWGETMVKDLWAVSLTSDVS